MLSIEKMLENAKLEHKHQVTAEQPGILSAANIPLFQVPKSIDALNVVLSASSLPCLEASDSLEVRVNKLEVIVRSRNLINIDFNIQRAREKIAMINRCILDEQACDAQEVELANLHINQLPRYTNKTVEELKRIKKDLEEAAGTVISSAEYDTAIQSLKRGDESAARYLEFMKEETRGAFWKERASELLEEGVESWCKVLLFIIKKGVVTVNELETVTSQDRVALLKTIYNLSSKRILEYDRHKDTVRICTE